jgi:hypothetical protein
MRNAVPTLVTVFNDLTTRGIHFHPPDVLDAMHRCRITATKMDYIRDDRMHPPAPHIHHVTHQASALCRDPPRWMVSCAAGTSLTCRGHVRPLLHLSLNLLAVHPSLKLTLLLTPSVAPRVVKELSSASSSHVDSSSRLQIINVRSERMKDVDTFDVAKMAEEAMDYATTLPDFFSFLYGAKEIDGVVNAFDIPPSFVIFDVSRALTSLTTTVVPKLCSRRRYSCNGPPRQAAPPTFRLLPHQRRRGLPVSRSEIALSVATLPRPSTAVSSTK